jgi:hypothetical protein
MFRYISAHRQLERFRRNADEGATSWLYYEGCLQGTQAKQTTTENIPYMRV